MWAETSQRALVNFQVISPMKLKYEVSYAEDAAFAGRLDIMKASFERFQGTENYFQWHFVAVEKVWVHNYKPKTE